MKIASRKLHGGELQAIQHSKGAYSINQILQTVNVDPSQCVLGQTVRISTLGNGNWAAYGGSATAALFNTFILTSLTPRTDGGKVDILNYQLDIAALPGVMNNYEVWIVLMRLRRYDLNASALILDISWPFWWTPYWFMTTMDTPMIHDLFVPPGSGLEISDIDLSGPNIDGMRVAFTSNNVFYGGDFPSGAYGVPNTLFTSDLLQQLGMANIKSHFALDGYEYEGSLGNYMRGQILYAYVPDSERSLDKRRDISQGYTNYSGDSPFQESQATFSNYECGSTGSSNTVLTLFLVFTIILAFIFAFLAFYPRGSRESRFS
jgi:hypothetical protein